MKRIVSALALLAACAIPAALRGDSLIIAGGGFVGLWDTEIDLANTLAEPTDVSLSVRGLPLGAPCPPNCTGKTYRVPGHGTIRVLASDFIGELYAGPQMIRVETDAAVPAPVVHVLDAGQIRVTKLSGEGVLWGVLSTVVSEGS